MWRFDQHLPKEVRNCEQLLIFLNYHHQGRKPSLNHDDSPSLLTNHVLSTIYKYYTRRPFGATPDYPVLLDGRGCTLSAHSYAVSFHCILINTRTALLISRDKRTRQNLVTPTWSWKRRFDQKDRKTQRSRPLRSISLHTHRAQIER